MPRFLRWGIERLAPAVMRLADGTIAAQGGPKRPILQRLRKLLQAEAC